MKSKNIYFALKTTVITAFFAMITYSCEKEITVDLPEYQEKIVVEGWIDYNEYATVFLTKSTSYFAHYTEETLTDMVITDALVMVSDLQGNTDTLTLGVDTTLAFPVRFKGSKIKGEYGGIYQLKIIYNNKTISATTTIPQPFNIDSVYYVEQDAKYHKGILRMKFKDQAGVNNFYRIFSMKLGKNKNFVPALGSVFDDRLFDGKETFFELYQGRASNIVSSDYYDDSLQYLNYYFGSGDTVIYKYATIDYPHYNFWYTAEWEISSGGNPFTSPAPVRSNIDGAIGVWGGYGSKIDTFIVQ